VRRIECTVVIESLDQALVVTLVTAVGLHVFRFSRPAGAPENLAGSLADELARGNPEWLHAGHAAAVGSEAARHAASPSLGEDGLDFLQGGIQGGRFQPKLRA
jgi:hypothetical protein